MTIKSALDILKEARELISDPMRWAQGYFSYDIEGVRANNRIKANELVGNQVSSHSEEAKCFCSLGAIHRVGDIARRRLVGDGPHVVALQDEAMDDAKVLLSEVIAPSEFSSSARVAVFNDSHTHEEVLAMFDRAIAKEEAK